MNLTEHFTLEAFIASREAGVHGIDNTPSDEIIERLKFTARGFEHMRLVLGVPIILLSGYRCPALNCITGGAMTRESLAQLIIDTQSEYVRAFAHRRIDIGQVQPNDSQHMRGEAGDFIAPKFGTPFECCRAIEASDVRVDQLIHEIGWGHASFVSARKPRREMLTIRRGAGYVAGIVA